MHLLRYWQLTRPCSGIGWVMLAVREWIMCRVPPKAFLIRAATSFSTMFKGIGGRNSPSGNTSSPSRVPAMPANLSTWSYHGAMSA